MSNFFKDLFGIKEQKSVSTTALLDGSPIFTQFGQSIYASDVVQNCIDVIATECSKMNPKHIRTDANDVRTIPPSSINRLFKVSPNPLMTTRDFLEKIIWQLFLNYNCFIYPVYKTYKDKNGVERKRYTAFYPLNPERVVFEQDPTNKIYLHFYFRSGQDFSVPYDEVIHLRKKFSVNDVMGGGIDGQPDNDALLKVLETNDTVIQGLGKAIKTSLAVQGIIKINSILDDELQAEERRKFEESLKNNESGILSTDFKGEYTPIKTDPKFLDDKTIQFLENKILRWFGVSLPILSGDFNDDQYQAFYEKTLEPLLITLGQAFTKALFTGREIDFGNEIVFYPKNMMYLSTKSKLDIIKIAGEQGLLTNDQKLLLLGYPPLGGEEGAKRTQSLNYVDVSLVNKYQMAKTTTGGEDEE